MLVIPAIDLKDGKCVRLLQGKKEAVTVYSDDPAAVARRWQSGGARLIHVVDLDGAFTGAQKNLDAIVKIREAVSVDIEVGGGIRDMDRVEHLFGLGINKVILGTKAVEDPEFLREAALRFPGKVFVGIDAKDGVVAVKGWVELTGLSDVTLAKKAEALGAGGIIYTDISKDGMLAGPNIPATEEVLRAVGIPVIASGGVSSMKDILRLKAVKGLWGVIVGKALYSGAVDYREALRCSQNG